MEDTSPQSKQGISREMTSDGGEKICLHPVQQDTLSGDKPLACTQCNKDFAQSDVLKRHMLTHTQEKEFACTQCYKAFSQLGTLKTHKLLHARQEEYACTQCDKLFSQSGYLKKT